MPSHAKEARNAVDELPGRLRRLAADLRAARTLGQLHAVVSDAVRHLPGCGELEFDPIAPDDGFDRRRLTVPLVGASGTLGVIHVEPHVRGGFKPGDLKLAGAVADLSAAVIDRCLHGDAFGATGVLSAALDGLPAGVLCFEPAGALVFANVAARNLFRDRLPASWPDIWRDHAPPGIGAGNPPFIWRGNGNLVHVTPRLTAAGAPGAIVLTDITPRVTAFGELIAAECWRCLREKVELVFGILAGPEGSPAALELLEHAADRLPAGSRTGPIDAEACGIIVPGGNSGGVFRLLRSIGRAAPAAPGLRCGVARLLGEGDTAEALLARATAALGPVSETARPEVLVFDRSRAVAESLAMILRRDYRVTLAADHEQWFGVLHSRSFEGLILELPAGTEANELGWLREALKLQPAAAPFFITEFPGPWELESLGLPVAPVFQKPFSVETIRAAVRNGLAVSASAVDG